MQEEIRRAIAYAAAGRVNSQFSSSVFSYDPGVHTSMSEGFDFGSGAHLGGARSGNMYHYGVGAHISLDVKGDQFSGFDYSSGSHFSGRVSGRSVQLYDCGHVPIIPMPADRRSRIAVMGVQSVDAAGRCRARIRSARCFRSADSSTRPLSPRRAP